ncbi:MAG TPA: hypothetical protein PLD20_13180 [Blastocatellia bacterium]|nr:hypothetical protein [Blastocatellia bacterium]HMZ18882.1 hypothetical protein [Blastocatellia bacterium]HNG30237.1 hypothetical protein [Blastocatellia bacterium]
MTTKRSSRSSRNSVADTAGADPFAVFQIIADARKIREKSKGEQVERARRIEHNADGMVKTVLGTADLSTAEVPSSVIEEIVEMLRKHR